MFLRRGQTGAAGRFGWLPEVTVITAAAPVLGSLVNPADPYMLHSPFPWLMLAPLAVALQHGLWAGLTSSVLLSGLAGWQALSSGSIPASFASWSIGCGITAMIAGQIRDTVRGRAEKLAQRADSLEDRLERSERTRHLIQLSHAKLEERVAARRSSLASAIEDAERRMSVAHSMHELGQVLLDALATQGHLHAATLYVAAREHGILLSEPVASFGGTGESSAAHALVVRAFRTSKLAAIVDAVEAARNDSSVLAAVPLITARRRTVGVVAVHQMPFMVFHAEHLNQVFVLAGHLADLLFDRWAALQANAGESVAQPSVIDAGNEPVGLDITVVEEEPAAAENTEAVAESRSIETQPVAESGIVGIFEPGRSVATQTRTFEAVVVTAEPVVVAAEPVVVAAEPVVVAAEPVVVVAEPVVVADEPIVVAAEPVVVAAAEPVATAAETTDVVPAKFEHTRAALEAMFEESSGEGANSTESPATEMESAASMEEVKAVSEVKANESEQQVVETPVAEPQAKTVAPPRKVMGKRAREAALKAALAAAAKAVRDRATETQKSSAPPSAAVTEAAVPEPVKVETTTTVTADAPKAEPSVTLTADTRTTARTILPPPPEEAHSHEAIVRESLPAPVESARSAILAAFARKANADETQSRPTSRPAATFRIARVALAKQPASQAPERRPVSELAPTAQSDEPVITLPPAKASDARASVRAAFQKTRNPADDTQVVRKSDAPAAEVARTEAHSEIRAVTTHAARTEATPAQSTPISDVAPRSDVPDAKRPSIEQARAAMLATVAKARSLLGKPRAAKQARIAEPTTETRSTRSHATRAHDDVIVAARSN